MCVDTIGGVLSACFEKYRKLRFLKKDLCGMFAGAFREVSCRGLFLS